MIIARQSTARTVMVGPVLDADGVAVTDCVVADFEGSVNGGDPAALNGSATLTHRGVGFYSLALTATDLGTVGQFEVTINDTVNACPMKEITVVEEAVYDAMFAASAVGYITDQPVNVTKWLGTAAATPTVAGVPEVDVTHLLGTSWLSPGTAGTPDVNVRLISGDSTAADNAEAFFDGTGYAGTNNVIPTVTTATNVTTVNGLAAGVVTATSIASDAITAAKIADGAIDAATFAADALAAFQSEANDALVAQRLDELLNADSDIDGAAPPTVGSVFHELMTKTAGSFTFDQTTDSLEALRDRGDAAWITATSVTVSDKTGFKLASDGLAAVVAWTVDITGSLTGSVGSVTGAVGSVTGNVGGNVTGSIGSLAVQAKADVFSEVASGINNADLPSLTELQTELGNLPTAAENATAVLTTQMTESYNADGAAPTAAQALFVIMQALTEGSISGTTWTIKKLDGSTTALTVTLDNSTPTSKTRSA